MAIDRFSLIARCLTPSVESTSMELEYTFYAKLKDKKQLEQAASSEFQSQWDIRFAYDNIKGTVRCRKTAVGSEDPTYTLCFKKVVEGHTGRTETEVQADSEVFDAVKSMAVSGMRKTRYKYPVPDSNLVWEVDVFQDLDAEEIEWVKLDLEVDQPLEKIPPFPVDLIDVIDPSEKDKIKDLLDNVLTVKPDKS